MTPLVRCRGIEKSFGGKAVLKGASLEVAAGETLVLLGGSGSGKSVLLKHMNGLLRPDARLRRGRRHGARDARRGRRSVPVRRCVSMLFQQGALFDSAHRRRQRRVSAPRARGSCPRSRSRARVAEMLGMVGLEKTEGLMPSELSGGMRKRAALARALALQPKAVLYDEPTTGLDPAHAAKINHLIRDLQQQLGLTSIVVTHDLASAFFVADRLAFLYEGQIRFIGTPAEARASADPPLHEFLTAS